MRFSIFRPPSYYCLLLLFISLAVAEPQISVQNRLQQSSLNRTCLSELDCTLGDFGECRDGICQCSEGTLLDQTETCVLPCLDFNDCEHNLYCNEQSSVCACPQDQIRDKFRPFCKLPAQSQHPTTTTKDYCLYDLSCGLDAFCHEPTNSCRCKMGYQPAANGINCQLIYCSDDYTCLLYHPGTRCDTDSNTCECEEPVDLELGEDSPKECRATSTTTERINEYINDNNDPSPSPNIAQIIFAIVILVIITIAIYSLCTCICNIPKGRGGGSGNNSRNSSANNSPQRNRRVDPPPKYSEAIHCSLPSYNAVQEPAPDYKTCFNDSKVVQINCELPPPPSEQ